VEIVGTATGDVRALDLAVALSPDLALAGDASHPDPHVRQR
jgi:hypothetical protein